LAAPEGQERNLYSNVVLAADRGTGLDVDKLLKRLGPRIRGMSGYGMGEKWATNPRAANPRYSANDRRIWKPLSAACSEGLFGGLPETFSSVKAVLQINSIQRRVQKC
jgi:hypothetical protein